MGYAAKRADESDENLLLSRVPGPWWVKAIAYFGMPAAASGYLIWLLGGQVLANQAVGLSTMQEITKSQATIAQALQQVAKELNDHRQENVRSELLLAQICANLASDNQQRSRCFQPR